MARIDLYGLINESSFIQINKIDKRFFLTGGALVEMMTQRKFQLLMGISLMSFSQTRRG